MGKNTKKAQPKQKEYADKRRQAKEKKVKEGDEVLLKREKSTTKSPWDPKPFKVVQVDGSKVTARRGDEKKARAKNHVKVVKIRPDYLRVKSKHQTKSRQEEELDLEVSEDTLERMRYPAGRSRARGTGGGATGSARGPSPQAGSSAGHGSHAG